jgi:hypothetical protein
MCVGEMRSVIALEGEMVRERERERERGIELLVLFCLPPTQVANHSVNVVQSLGRDAIKALGVPPDAFIQCAVQLAFNRSSNGRPAPTYEACSTRSFLHGRLDVC